MKRRISLFIDGKRADLDGQSLVLFNHSLEDLTNPTIVKNSYSQQVTLPGTPRNNDIFGSLWKTDRVTSLDSFDPMRRTPFAIYDETDEVVESGYIKVDNVIRRKKKAEYKVTLYGGLGSFFYSLSYNEDGTKKTLADLAFFGNDTPFDITVNAATVAEAWEALATGEGRLIWDVINFAPAYNGHPQGGFDARKVWLKAHNVPGVRENRSDGGVTYSTRNGGYTLLSLPDALTEWEVGDLRSYLQRPVLNVIKLLDAIRDTRNNGGFSVTIDPSILSGEVKDAWLTLPMIDNTAREGIDVTVNKQSLLGGMGSPAEWLLSLSKMLNWRFVFDSGSRAVSIVPNHAFYQDTLEDVSRLVDRSREIDIVPLPMDKRWFRFGIPVDGEFAQKYRETYGIDFGSVRVDTNYQFNADEKDVLDGVIARGAVMAVETSKYYRTMKQSYSGNNYPSVLLGGNVSQTLWNGNNPMDFPVGGAADIEDLEYNDGYDFWPKVQLHGADNKSQDGSGVLLWYFGEQSGQGHRYYLTDDDSAMVAANDGVPCWKINYDDNERQGIPYFTRYKTSGNVVVVSWDFSNPAEIPIPNVTMEDGAGIYARNWRDYIADRYDKESRTMTCRLRLRDRKVSADLFRKFYWIDGSIWSLNAIRNHSLATSDATECEFVKVQDRENYLGYTPAPTPTPTPPEPTPGNLFIKVNGQTVIDYDAPYSATRYAFTLEYTEGATVRYSTTRSWAYVASNETDIYIEGRAAGDTGYRMATVTFTATKDGKEAKAVVNIRQNYYQREGVISMSPSGDQTVGKDATSLQFTFTTYPQGAVLMNATQSWVTWNSATNTLSVSANTGSQRTAIIEFYLQRYSYEGAAKQTFKLTQLARTATIYGITSVTPASVNRDYQAAEVDFSFVTNPASATIRAILGGASWLSWDAGAKKLSISENSSVDSREATVTFYVDGHATDYQTKSVTITQGGRSYWGITSVTPTSLIKENGSGSQVMSFVTSPSGSNVLADLGNADWLAYDAATKTLSWTDNTSGEVRSANVIFYVEGHKGDWQTKTVSVRQKASAIPYLLDIPENTGIAPYEGGELEFAYVTNGTLRWDEPTSPRISVASAEDGIITLGVSENPDIDSSDNIGSVRFYLQEDVTKEATITLGQAGFAYYMSLNPLKITAAATGGFYDVALNTNVPVDKIGRTINGSGVGVPQITANSARVHVQANMTTERLDPKATIDFYCTDDPRVRATLTIAQRGSLPIENE